MAELTAHVTDHYYFPRLLEDGNTWVGISLLTFGRGRIIRARLDDPNGIDDGW
jgi:hypothetical protein